MKIVEMHIKYNTKMTLVLLDDQTHIVRTMFLNIKSPYKWINILGNLIVPELVNDFEYVFEATSKPPFIQWKFDNIYEKKKKIFALLQSCHRVSLKLQKICLQ